MLLTVSPGKAQTTRSNPCRVEGVVKIKESLIDPPEFIDQASVVPAAGPLL
jgi:hypothetical protein